jgi:ceramide glucosyltransferase
MLKMVIPLIQAYLLLTIGLFFLILLVGHILTAVYLTLYPRFLPKNEFAPKVSVIKPVKGLDPQMEENFVSFCRLDYPNDYELIFAAEEDDPAIRIVRAIKATGGDMPIRIVRRPCPTGWMGRVANMVSGVEAAEYRTLVFSDTDVRASPDFLKRFVQPLGHRSIGLVFGWPAYRGARTLASAFLAMSMNSGILLLAPPALVGYRAPIFRFALGTTMAVRKEVLLEIGGLEPFATLVTEDIPLARAVIKRGYSLHLVRSPVIVMNDRETLRGWVEHVVRWLIITRHHMPLVYALSFPYFMGIPHAMLNILLAWWTQGDLRRPLGLLVLALVARILSLVTVNAILVGDRAFFRYIWSVPLHDVIIALLWLWGWVQNEIAWRGARYRILPGARVVRLT